MKYQYILILLCIPLSFSVSAEVAEKPKFHMEFREFSAISMYHVAEMQCGKKIYVDARLMYQLLVNNVQIDYVTSEKPYDKGLDEINDLIQSKLNEIMKPEKIKAFITKVEAIDSIHIEYNEVSEQSLIENLDWNSPIEVYRFKVRLRESIMKNIELQNYEGASDHINFVSKAVRELKASEESKKEILDVCSSFGEICSDLKNRKKAESSLRDFKIKIEDVKGNTVKFIDDNKYYSKGDSYKYLMIDEVRSDGVDLIMKYMRSPYLLTVYVEH